MFEVRVHYARDLVLSPTGTIIFYLYIVFLFDCRGAVLGWLIVSGGACVLQPSPSVLLPPDDT